MPDQFWSLTPREFSLMCEGYDDKHKREWNNKQIELYLHRFIAATIHNIGAGFSKDAEGIEPKDLIKLPLFDGDDKKGPSVIDKDKFKQIVEKDGKRWPHE